MKRLLVMRHAKSDWDGREPDHERPLNKRGRRSAQAMGQVLADLEEVPEHAISSTAVRARTTLLMAVEAGGWNTTADETDELYNTSTAGAVQVVRNADIGDVDRLLLVGHEPTWSSLVERLSGGRVAMKTATIVGLDVPIDSWEQLGEGQATIAYVLQSRHFLDD